MAIADKMERATVALETCKIYIYENEESTAIKREKAFKIASEREKEIKAK